LRSNMCPGGQPASKGPPGRPHPQDRPHPRRPRRGGRPPAEARERGDSVPEFGSAGAGV